MFADKFAFRSFDKSVRANFRYARTDEQSAFLASVAATSADRVKHLEKGYLFFRAQLGNGWRPVEIAPEVFEEFEAPHDPHRMMPDVRFIGDGRVNAKGIACLYLATNEETAALEVRPLIGSYITIARFRTTRDLRIVDCSEKSAGNLFAFLAENLTNDQVDEIVWNDINSAFSKPVERADSGLTYIPTQIIAETLRLLVLISTEK